MNEDYKVKLCTEWNNMHDQWDGKVSASKKREQQKQPLPP
jgi:hypothetical protein